MEGGAVRHNFERDPPRDHPCQVWFNLAQRFQRRRFKCDLLSKYIWHSILEITDNFKIKSVSIVYYPRLVRLLHSRLITLGSINMNTIISRFVLYSFYPLNKMDLKNIKKIIPNLHCTYSIFWTWKAKNTWFLYKFNYTIIWKYLKYIQCTIIFSCLCNDL
jgi:hypothetical protein